jgi:hypothetical protein
MLSVSDLYPVESNPRSWRVDGMAFLIQDKNCGAATDSKFVAASDDGMGETPQSGTSILPQEWSVEIEHARSKSPELFEELLAVRRACIDVSLMIDQFSSTRETYRNDSVAKTIQNNLSDICERCRAILTKLEV